MVKVLAGLPDDRSHFFNSPAGFSTAGLDSLQNSLLWVRCCDGPFREPGTSIGASTARFAKNHQILDPQRGLPRRNGEHRLIGILTCNRILHQHFSNVYAPKQISVLGGMYRPEIFGISTVQRFWKRYGGFLAGEVRLEMSTFSSGLFEVDFDPR
jgi:hypothetical protein